MAFKTTLAAASIALFSTASVLTIAAPSRARKIWGVAIASLQPIALCTPHWSRPPWRKERNRPNACRADWKQKEDSTLTRSKRRMRSNEHQSRQQWWDFFVTDQKTFPSGPALVSHKSERNLLWSTLWSHESCKENDKSSGRILLKVNFRIKF